MVGRVVWVWLSQELSPAMFAAKIKGFAIALSAECRRFVHLHPANWVDLHRFSFVPVH
jgi:hypothetical protein